MAQEFLHLLDGVAAVDQHTAGRMAQIMETNLRQVVLFQQFSEAPAHIIRLKDGTVRPLADVLVLRVGPSGQMPFFFLPMKKVYIQSAFRIDAPEKRQQEILPLLKSGDFFKKIVVSSGSAKPHMDENGISYAGVIPFLLDDNSLNW